MSADVNAIVDKIIADAEKKVRTDLKNISSKVKKDFVYKAKEAVSAYYANYSPKIYIRTNNLRNGVIDEDISFEALNGNGYGAWIQFNSNGMSDYEDGTYSADIVVSNFMSGIHGRSSVAVEDNPARDLMNDFQNNYKKTLDSYFIDLGYTVN
jgi:hypothetical protein